MNALDIYMKMTVNKYVLYTSSSSSASSSVEESTPAEITQQSSKNIILTMVINELYSLMY